MKIPSELIEPHCKNFMMSELEGLAYGMTAPEKIRQRLDAVNSFVSQSSGIHARIAVSNEYYKITKLSDDQMISLAKEIFNSLPAKG